MDDIIVVNRAPVLTLWAAVVAKRLGYDEDESLSLGRALAALNAQSKGRMIGVFGPPKGSEEGGRPKRAGLGEEFWIDLMGRDIPAKNTGDGVRAVSGDDPVSPDSARKYLQDKLGDNLDAVHEALEDLADSMPPNQLASRAYGLYEKFRPKIPSGRAGWGAKGELDLALVRSLAGR